MPNAGSQIIPAVPGDQTSHRQARSQTPLRHLDPQCFVLPCPVRRHMLQPRCQASEPNLPPRCAVPRTRRRGQRWSCQIPQYNRPARIILLSARSPPNSHLPPPPPHQQQAVCCPCIHRRFGRACRRRCDWPLSDRGGVHGSDPSQPRPPTLDVRTSPFANQWCSPLPCWDLEFEHLRPCDRAAQILVPRMNPSPGTLIIAALETVLQPQQTQSNTRTNCDATVRKRREKPRRRTAAGDRLTVRQLRRAVRRGWCQGPYFCAFIAVNLCSVEYSDAPNAIAPRLVQGLPGPLPGPCEPR